MCDSVAGDPQAAGALAGPHQRGLGVGDRFGRAGHRDAQAERAVARINVRAIGRGELDHAAGVGDVTGGLIADLVGLGGVAHMAQPGLVHIQRHIERRGSTRADGHGIRARRVGHTRHVGAGLVGDLVGARGLRPIAHGEGLLGGVAALRNLDDAELARHRGLVVGGDLHIVLDRGVCVDAAGSHTQRAIRGLAVGGEHVMVGGVHDLFLDLGRAPIGMRGADQGGDAGSERRRHGRAAHDLRFGPGAGGSGDDAHAGRGDIGLDGAVIGTMDAAGSERCDGVFAFLGIIGIDAHAQVG